MTTWYEASYGQITPVAVIKETPKTVTVLRSSSHSVVKQKEAGHTAYFPTWEEAHVETSNERTPNTATSKG